MPRVTDRIRRSERSFVSTLETHERLSALSAYSRCGMAVGMMVCTIAASSAS